MSDEYYDDIDWNKAKFYKLPEQAQIAMKSIMLDMFKQCKDSPDFDGWYWNLAFLKEINDEINKIAIEGRKLGLALEAGVDAATFVKSGIKKIAGQTMKQSVLSQSVTLAKQAADVVGATRQIYDATGKWLITIVLGWFETCESKYAKMQNKNNTICTPPNGVEL